MASADKQTVPPAESEVVSERELEGLRAVEAVAKNLWERRSDHRTGAPD
jgi:hypothetical protein